VGARLIRIVSDVHFAERSSRVSALSQLLPLLEGADLFVFNGDTLDTRPGGDVQRTARLRREVLAFFGSCGTPVTFLTGNHDPDFTPDHSLDLEDGRVLVTHGDVLFDSIVPWSGEAELIRHEVLRALDALPADGSSGLEGRLGAFRSVEATISQRHQAERNPLRYAIRLANDTVWPPRRAFSMLKAWREAPGKAAALAATHRPKARCIVIGHTHRPGVWRSPSGVAVVNTGSFSAPFGALTAEVSAGVVRVRKVESRRGRFHPGRAVDEIPLA
jgi:predicted phosphodiesterase